MMRKLSALGSGRMVERRAWMVLGMGILALVACPALAQTHAEPGLLFAASFDNTTKPDVAAGDPQPNFKDHVSFTPDGAGHMALKDEDDGILTYRAPGNIFAERGTVRFDWRSSYPVGEAPFVLFRVGFADHTSWDMAWLRIDYNGHGFDAFVTDANLARIRVHYVMPVLPKPDEWVHLTFSWDQTTGVTLYVNGVAVGSAPASGEWSSGLDQFGLASRTVSPHQVQSRYNFMRGGDYANLRIYDHALSAAAVAGADGRNAPPLTLDDPAFRAKWLTRYGWNRLGDMPVVLTAPSTRIRKVEFADAKDMKEWMYKATDGIAETTWPGVYNRSRLPGRNDYFTLPDWNVYVEGGKALTLTLPDEPWNHLEIQGAAYGSLDWAKDGITARLADRPKDQERSFHTVAARTGGVLTFTNAAQETPIQEIAAYHIDVGSPPEGTTQLSYTVHAAVAPDSPDLDELRTFIAGRYPAEARSMVVALPDGAPKRARKDLGGKALPLVHILIPYEFGASPPNVPLARSWNYGWENMHDALDGIALDLPPLQATPTANGLILLNIQVKDPIWPMRDLMDISVAVKPGEAHTLWLDTRDRILPNASLYLTIASASPDFSATTLDGAQIRLIFKDRAVGKIEHIADRLNQVRDNWGYLVEEHTGSKREGLYARLVADATDLFRVDPDNGLGRAYWADIMYGSQGSLPFAQPTPPAGVPLWAFRQLEDLKLVRHFVNWWIDNRQVPYGDFGGGLSDDTDLVEQWPGLALMGVDVDKITRSHDALADAIYKNGMFTNGLATIATDELHAYEDGINSNAEAMYLHWGNPKQVERLMTTVAALKRIIMPNPAGHLHFASNWYSGSHVYREGSWEWGKYYSYLVTHPGVLMGYYNGDPEGRRIVIGLADGILVHGKQDAQEHWTYPDEINWRSDATRAKLPANTPPFQLFWAAYRWTGDAKYLTPIYASKDEVGLKALADLNENVIDVLGKRADWGAEAVKAVADKRGGKGGDLQLYLAWETSGDKTYLDRLYGREIAKANQRMPLVTEGHWWVDRVEVPSYYLQRTRLGGIALARNYITLGHYVSWRFAHDEDAVKVALLLPNPTPEGFTVEAFNTTPQPVSARMTTWMVTAGLWEMRCGKGDHAQGDETSAQHITLERSASVNLSFAPGASMCHFRLLKAGVPTETRQDIGIGPDDVTIKGRTVQLTVHGLGAQPSGAGVAELRDTSGNMLAIAPIPPLAAPRDDQPVTARIMLTLPAHASTTGVRVHVALDDGVPEVTQLNNEVVLP